LAHRHRKRISNVCLNAGCARSMRAMCSNVSLLTRKSWQKCSARISGTTASQKL
jgi:hypothetical protein